MEKDNGLEGFGGRRVFFNGEEYSSLDMLVYSLEIEAGKELEALNGLSGRVSYAFNRAGIDITPNNILANHWPHYWSHPKTVESELLRLGRLIKPACDQMNEILKKESMKYEKEEILSDSEIMKAIIRVNEL